MKLSKSKLALAKVINENGGWSSDEANFAAMDKIGSDHDCPDICFYKDAPVFISGKCMWNSNKPRSIVLSSIMVNNVIPSWHQCVLSREEYYHAYPKADADGWIEWNGGECPVNDDSLVDVRFPDGSEYFNTGADWDWSNTSDTPISHYRPSKKEAKPEFCESVTHGIPEPESIDGLCAKVTEENKHQHVDAKPTIEQLAQDYRNKLDFANSKQKEADEAKDGADAILKALEIAAEDLGFKIEQITTKQDGLQKIANYNEGCSNALSIKWCN